MGRDFRRFAAMRVAVGVSSAALIFVTGWLLTRGTRGAEIAGVLALPAVFIAAAAALRELSRREGGDRARLEGGDGGGLLLVRAEQKITEQLGFRTSAKSVRRRRDRGTSDTRSSHIALRFQGRSDAVTGDKRIDQEHGRQRDEDRTSLRRILAESHWVLVLGEAGSGKTTALLELARDLLAVPEEHSVQSASVAPKPIPVVLKLSTWGEQQAGTEHGQKNGKDGASRSPGKQISLDDWMVSALHLQYGIPSRHGTLLVRSDRLLPLFDGLDEVSDRYRDMCVQAINRFVRTHLADIVVSCRTEEYERIPTRLSLQEAVEIKLPTRGQVHAYLERTGALGVLRDAEGNDGLQSLLTTPLMLDIVAKVYAGPSGQHRDVVSGTGTLAQRQNQLLTAYKDRMLQVRPVPRILWAKQDHPTREVETSWKSQTVHWLVWLAQLMSKQAQAEFYLDQLQPSCLENPAQERLVLVLPALCAGLITAIITTLIIASSWPFTVAAPWGLFCGILIGLDGLGWRTLLGRDGPRVIVPVEEARWKWSRVRLAAGAGIGAAAGIAAGLIARLLGGLRELLHPEGAWASSLGVLQKLGEWPAWPAICVAGIGACAVMSGLGGGLSKGRTVPNEGILRSARRALSIGIPAGVIGGSIAGVLIRPIASVYTTVMMSFFFAFSVGLSFGGRTCLRHITLRLLLVYNDFAPLRYNAFLEDSTDRLVLRRSATGYIFFHQMIRSYFAVYDDPHDAPHTRSAVRILSELVRLLSRSPQ
jgi:DNA polymerase III delta prime subunit